MTNSIPVFDISDFTVPEDFALEIRSNPKSTNAVASTNFIFELINVRSVKNIILRKVNCYE